MASPKVFVSSTCYDLKYIRENIKYFIETLGYESVLSEEGDIYYNPKAHTHDACIAEVPNCQLFILIIGGRYGGKYKSEDYSITNAEYKKAIELKIPVFTLVEQSVYNEHLFYSKNKTNEEIDRSKIIYPNVDNIKIFEFIDEVRRHSINNAFVPFKNFNDIEVYLKKQWAGMMFSFLSKSMEEERIYDTLEVITTMNEKIEMLSRQILSSVGTDEAKLIATLYEEILVHECIKDLTTWGIKPTIKMILQNSTFKQILESNGVEYEVVDMEAGFSFNSLGKIRCDRFDSDERGYQKLREKLEESIHGSGIEAEKLLA